MGRKKYTIESCQQIAEERGGECLSEEYVNCDKLIKWKCKEGHEWDAVFTSIKNRKSWCKICCHISSSKKQMHSINLCQQIAEERGGECLSGIYEGCKKKMKWKCKQGHEWDSTFDNIKQGKWCSICKKCKKYTIEECQQVAKELGGECLSTKYINVKTLMEWKCSEGHTWDAVFTSIKNQNTWCPDCSKGKSEKLCRKILEELTQEKFPSVRPYFLKHYKTGFNLELDGYCEKLQMAFEYHGVQHYKYFPNFFHKKGKYQFEEQKERDKLKIELCDKNNIKLIIIPYCYDYTDEQKLREFITNSL